MWITSSYVAATPMRGLVRPPVRLTVPKRAHHQQKALPVGKQVGSTASQGLTPLGWLNGPPFSRGSRNRFELVIIAIINIQALKLRTIININILRIHAFKSLEITCQRDMVGVWRGALRGGWPGFNWSPWSPWSPLWPAVGSSCGASEFLPKNNP